MIKAQAHISTLENEKNDMRKRIELLQGDSKTETKELAQRVAEKEAEISGLLERMRGKDELLKTTEKRLESATKSEQSLKEQLTNELSRA